jgi:hypothetical protein
MHLQVELGPVSHRRGLERVGEELLLRGGRLSKVHLHQSQHYPWLEVELASAGTRWSF